MEQIFGETPDYFVTSAEKGQGKEELSGFIYELVSEFEAEGRN